MKKRFCDMCGKEIDYTVDPLPNKAKWSLTNYKIGNRYDLKVSVGISITVNRLTDLIDPEIDLCNKHAAELVIKVIKESERLRNEKHRPTPGTVER
ncbi:MAG: hypothetical protein JW885_02685 [Deltaproteobacteria bacterium]|nr:hypothetical protein [Candidatus Zymogenaceae bacterium]